MLNLKKKFEIVTMTILTLILLIAPVKVFASTVNTNVTAEKQVNITKSTITVKKGKSKKLKYKLVNTTKSNIVWTSSNPKVVKVNAKTGKISGKSGGTAIVTATIKGSNISDSIQVTCKDFYTLRVKTTGYCNCRSCCGIWAGHRTATGTKPRANRTIAVDKNVIKLGSKVKIGKRMYVAEDTGVHGRTIDVYYSSHRRADGHGVQYKTVTVYY